MVKVIGHHGAHSLGFSPNTLSAFNEALETGNGFCTPLAKSMDGEVFCIDDITRCGQDVAYNLRDKLCDKSAAILGHRRFNECMADEIKNFRYKNGALIPTLGESLDLLRPHPGSQIFLKLRGEDVAKDTLKTLQATFVQTSISPEQVIVCGYEPATLQAFRSSFGKLKICLIFYPETFPQGVKLYPWSVKDYSCYKPFRASVLDSPLMKRLKPDLFSLEVTTIRESTVRAILRKYNTAKIALWFDNEPRPDKSFALLERMKNGIISPYINHVITKYPRQMTRFLKEEGITLNKTSVAA